MTSALVLSLWLSLGAAGPSPVPAAAQAQAPRDTPPPAIENARRERELRAAIAAGTATRETFAELAVLLNRQNRIDDTVEALRGAAALDPDSAEPQHRIAVFMFDKSRTDTTADAPRRRAYIEQGLEAENRALALQPDYMEALTYKNILLRLKANASGDPMEQKRLIDEADALRDRVIEMQRARTGAAPAAATAGPFAGFAEPFEQTLARLQPLRVGGELRVPAKITDVKPVYPEEAKAARVQGVVIIEAVVDDTGAIANARVLRSIPLLDAAALGAVSQWRFAPAEANGRPAAVLMTVTVNFTLMQ